MAITGLGFNFAESIGLRSLNAHRAAINQSLERLATGKKLNHASDDPAGSIAADHLQADQKSVLARLQQIKLDEGRYGAVEGGLAAVGDILQNLKSHIIAAANTAGLTESERAAYQIDADGAVDALDHLANTLRFNGELVLSGYIGAGASGQGGNVAGSLGALRSGGTLNLVSGDLQGAQSLVHGLLDSITGSRAAVGATLKSLDSETRDLTTRNENLAAAISQIVDTDYASEVSSLVRSQALADAAQFAAQAARNLQAETVLALIRAQPLGKPGAGDKKTA